MPSRRPSPNASPARANPSRRAESGNDPNGIAFASRETVDPRGSRSREAVVAICLLSALVTCTIAVACASASSGQMAAQPAFPWLAAIPFLASSIALSWLSWVDIRIRRLPTRVVRAYAACAASFSLAMSLRAGGSLGTVLVMASGRMLSGLVPVLLLCAVALAADAISRRRGGGEALVGGGDIRLMCAVSLQLGTGALLAIAIACMAGIAASLATRERTFPFGPCLALPATAIALVQLLLTVQWI